MRKDLGVDEQALIRNFNFSFNRIKDRDERIKKNDSEMKTLKSVVDKFNQLKKENMILRDENEKDRRLTKSSMELYERITGEGVGIGDLFSQSNEGENNGN